MDFPVLCFERDNTVDVSPPLEEEPVPLSWVQFFAHETEHDVWATGNQQLQIEAGIPTPYEAKQKLEENGRQVSKTAAGGHENRTTRLRLIEDLYVDIYGQKASFIVVDNASLRTFASDTNWTYYAPGEFVKRVQKEQTPLPDPTGNKMSGEQYMNTNEHGTYKELLQRIEDKL